MAATKSIVTLTGGSPSPRTHAQMHAEHQQWYGEDALWHEEIAVWQGEIKKAQADIERLSNALKDHEAALQKHAAAIRLYEQDMRTHEHALADYEQGGEGANLFSLAQRHSLEADKHADQRARHETVKRDHHTTMAHWNLLLKGLVKDCGPATTHRRL